ncbi:hypothetical protein [Desulfosediminicola flagellatus]|uniref:hypothetical protein n=1 Tax=Desulfosediminicola flagellatus TaxID=2569541 RepID=UPI0010AD51A2|nr:hypothetical protein [Desulfosediminicola flagellatus]
MSVKRLKHHAQNLGQMFCGWELMFDYKRLAEMEKGTLRIDMLTEECFHDGNAIDPLGIVDRLRDWMIRDLDDHNLDPGRLECVELNIDFKTQRQLGQKNKRSSWKDVTPHFIHCTLNCTSKVITSTRQFSSKYQDEEEWPESYSWIR